MFTFHELQVEEPQVLLFQDAVPLLAGLVAEDWLQQLAPLVDLKEIY